MNISSRLKQFTESQNFEEVTPLSTYSLGKNMTNNNGISTFPETKSNISSEKRMEEFHKNRASFDEIHICRKALRQSLIITKS